MGCTGCECCNTSTLEAERDALKAELAALRAKYIEDRDQYARLRGIAGGEVAEVFALRAQVERLSEFIRTEQTKCGGWNGCDWVPQDSGEGKCSRCGITASRWQEIDALLETKP